MQSSLYYIHKTGLTLFSVCSQNATLLAKALAVLASSDEHTNLSQVMSKLAEVQENLQQIIEEQADSDFFTFSELLKDYLSQISAVKVMSKPLSAQSMAVWVRGLRRLY